MSLRDLPLNDRQLEVLRWISEGCPDGVMTGTSHKTSAVALKSRRLVTITKRRGSWSAELTDDGRYYLEHDTYRPSAAAPQLRAPEVMAAATTAPVRTEPPSAIPRRRAPGTRPPAPTVQLIADVIASGGELVVNAEEDRRPFEQLVRAAIRWNKVPEGKILTFDRGPTWRRLVIRLEDQPAWMTADLQPISLPAQLRNPHDVVKGLQESDFEPKGQARRRALLLVQALLAEATGRGYTAAIPKRAPAWETYNRQQEPVGDFVIGIEQHDVGVIVRQVYDRVPHEPTARELGRTAKEPWFRIPTHDSVQTERLKLSLLGRFEHRQSSWSDSKTRALDDLLPEILQEIELRAAAAERDRLAKLVAAARRRQEWEAAMELAKVEYREARRAAILDLQIEAWEQADRVRSYAAAMEATIGGLADQDAASAALAWVCWARGQADRLDPLRRPLGMPADREPSASELEPFLHGLSPYGPR